MADTMTAPGLTLIRHAGEAVELTMGDEAVTVTVVKVSATRVTLRFDAPQSVDIWRSEVGQSDVARVEEA